MQWVTRKVAVCDECGHEWLPKGEAPKQCPSRKCRSRRWNSGEANRGGRAIPATDEATEVPVATGASKSRKVGAETNAPREVHVSHDTENCHVYACGQCRALGVTNKRRGL